MGKRYHKNSHQNKNNSNYDWKKTKNGTFSVNAGELLSMQDIFQNDIKLGNT